MENTNWIMKLYTSVTNKRVLLTFQNKRQIYVNIF